MSTTGRNSPCPCGSGRKYKHCCLTRAQTATGITAADRDEVTTALLRFTRREEFDLIVEDAALMWAGEDCDDDPAAAMDSILAHETSAATFFEWLFFDLPLDDKRPAAAWFVDRHPRTLNPRALDYLRLMLGTHLRPYQVRTVDPGVGLTLRDLWTREEVYITEQRGSTQLVIWDVLVARVATHTDGTHQFEGSTMLLPAACAPTLEKVLRTEHRAFLREFPGESLDQFLKMRAPIFHQTWYELVAMAEPPELVTTEGDEITLSELVLDAPRAGEALVALLQEPDFEPGEAGTARWVETGSDGPREIAQVSCDRGTLTVQALSKPRAARARARLEQIVGPLNLRSERHEAPDLSPDAASIGNPDGDAGIELDSLPEIAAWREAQDRAWLDLEIPALDGRTPREAAQDRRLKPRLVGLLMELENREARMATPRPGRDLTWMWKELRLKRP